MTYKVMTLSFEDLNPEEQFSVGNNGSGKEYANYIKVVYNNNVVLLESDAIEPEDKTFSRDLSWIAEALQQAYDLGKTDASS